VIIETMTNDMAQISNEGVWLIQL